MEYLDKKDQQLYTNKHEHSKKRTVLKKKSGTEVKTSWGADTRPTKRRKKPSVAKMVFGFSIFFLILAIGYFVFQMVAGNGKVSTKNIDIEILGNAFAEGGEELPLQIQVTNRNSVPLEYSDLLIQYPDGAGELVRERVSVGTVKSGDTVVESRDIVLYGRQGDQQEIQATIEYRIKGSNAIFHKEYSHFVTLSSAPLDLSVEATDQIVSGQKTSFRVKVRANNDVINQNVGIKIEYPIGFRFEESDIAPAYGNNVWDLGDLGAGVEKEIIFSGVLFGESGEERAFRFFVGPYKGDTDLSGTYSSYIHTASITRPFIGTQVLIAGIEDEIVPLPAGENIPVTIKWSNNLATRVDDVVLEVSIIGDALNKTTVQQSGGFYDSNTNTSRWDKTNYPSFASVQPGARDTLTINFSTFPLYQNGVLKNEEDLKLSISIRGKRPNEGGSLESIENSSEKTIQLNSDLYMTAEGFFRNSPFNNAGTIPPVVGSETEYTILWSVANSANPVSGAKVTTVLPSYVVYKNRISPASENIVWNASTRELTWNIGALARGTGLTTAAKEVSFLVGITPSVSQIGSAPLLTGPVRVTAKDLFTGQNLEDTERAVSTQVRNDTNYTSVEGRVAP